MIFENLFSKILTYKEQIINYSSFLWHLLCIIVKTDY